MIDEFQLDLIILFWECLCNAS